MGHVLKKIVYRIIGALQCVLGGTAAAFAFLLYASPEIKDALTITLQESYLAMFVSLVFATISILSGLILVKQNSQGS